MQFQFIGHDTIKGNCKETIRGNQLWLRTHFCCVAMVSNDARYLMQEEEENILIVS